MSGRLKTATAALLLVAGLVANGCASRPSIEVALVTPDFETSPVSDPGDAADDAVILVGLPDTAVRILATNKQAGLAVYSLAGNELDFLTTGRLNNVDAINIAPDRFLVAASNRTAISIDLYEADLRKDSVVLVSRVTLDVLQPYGLCMGRTPERSVFVGDTTGNVEHWVLADDLTAAAPAQRVGLYRLDSQTEGCVFDANDNTLYVGEEDRGIWAVDLASGQRRLLDSVGAGFLVADVEGLDIYQGDSQRLLVASSQGDNTYVLYRLPEGAPLAKFRIFDAPGDGIDGSEDTDGVAVTNQPLPGYPRGILVVQDGFNRKPRARQNFKGVDWRKIEALIPTH